MWLLIDDVRDLNCDFTARTPEDARTLLASSIDWECICFDHDLGAAESGYDILVWALENGYLNGVPRIQLVTANPVGRSNMGNALKNAGYYTTDFINYYKKVSK